MIQLILPVLLLLTAVTSDAQLWSQSIQFRQENLCPTTPASPSNLLSGVRSQQSCSVECALRSDCAVYGFNSSMSQCRMASTEELLNSWQTPTPCLLNITNTSTMNCTSQLNSHLPGVLSFRSSLIAYLDFRIGQTNLVKSGLFGVLGKSSGIKFDSEGAVFPSNKTNDSNYIELDSTASPFESIIDFIMRSKNFTVYARVEKPGSKSANFYSLHNCSEPTDSIGSIFYRDGRLNVFTKLPTSNAVVQTSNEIIEENAEEPVRVSVGTLFSVTNLNIAISSAYYNGAVLSFTDINTPWRVSPSTSKCVRLGYHSDSRFSLVGRYVCFALIGKALTAHDFAELDQLCA